MSQILPFAVVAVLIIFSINVLSSLDLYLGQARPSRRTNRVVGKIIGYHASYRQRHWPPIYYPIIEFQKANGGYPLTFRARQTKGEVARWQRHQHQLIVCYNPHNPKDARLLIPAEFFPASTREFVWFWVIRASWQVVLPIIIISQFLHF